MVGLSLRDAAREAGVSKSTIFRAIKSGRLSAARNDDGGFDIDPSELFRVYSPRNEPERAAAAPLGQDATSPGTPETPVLKAEIEGLQALLALMRDQVTVRDSQIEDLKGQRDGWQRQAETAMRQITDQRPADIERRRRGWFAWRKAG